MEHLHTQILEISGVDDTSAIAAAIRALHDDRERCRRMGDNARTAAVARYDRRRVTGDYIRLFNSLATS